MVKFHNQPHKFNTGDNWKSEKRVMSATLGGKRYLKNSKSSNAMTSFVLTSEMFE
jgi:hypothetical protein